MTTPQMAENAALLLEIRADLPGLPAARRCLMVGKLLDLATRLGADHGEEAAFNFLRLMLSTGEGIGHA
jgi:hypothetical protein